MHQDNRQRQTPQRTVENNTAAVKSTKNSVKVPDKCHAPVILVCVVMLLFIVAQLLLKTPSLAKQNPYVSVIVIQFIVFILPCAFMSAFAGRQKGTFTGYNLKLIPPKMLGFVFASLAVMLFGSMIIKYLGYILFGAVSTSTVVYEHDNMFTLLAATVIVPAFTEEILFRGVVFNEYQKRGTGALGAILGSAVLFAFIHFDISNFASYIFAGIILGISVHVTHSVLAPIFIHLMNNTVCLFTDTFLKRVSKESISSFFVFFLLTVLFLVSLFVFFESLEWICNAKADKSASENSNNDESGRTRLLPYGMKISSVVSNVLFTPALIVVIFLYIITIALF